MILKKEIQNKSIEWGVPPDTVDKDWVLGHFLSAMFSIEKFKNELIFKGGTALRKCYFNDYRFSEDLDFTAIDPDYVISVRDIDEITQTANKNSGVLFHIDKFKELKFEDKLTGYEIKLKYWGANHSKSQEPADKERWVSGIKVEIILYEQVVFKPVMKKIIHPYSDAFIFNSHVIPCYDLKEVTAEKLRALIQRSYTAPRDFYDIYSLCDRFKVSEWKEIISAFVQKTKFKGYDPESIEKVFNETTLKSLRNAWNNSIKHQISQADFPEIEIVLSKVKNIIEKHILVSTKNL
jgi:predicted nucleotidyltransferase component of viral defense system